MACPDPERLQALVAGSLTAVERDAVASHADDCEACRAAIVALFHSARGRGAAGAGVESTVHAHPATDETAHADPATAQTLASGSARTGPPAELAPGTRVDRYVIEHRLGAGAMGVVHAARDPELDRPVAIKLLRHAGDDDALRTRLYREAQALARVDHANVVSVYDVGTHDGQVFVAMEMIRGGTLRSWLAKPRTLREIIAVLVAAGRGLAAAHAAQLVHRDFKPDNVLVGDDGIARVTDFGLARGTGGDDRDETTAPDDESRAGSDPAGATGTPLNSTLTVTGSLLGTPVYAAPEQLEGGRAGPLADQFSFCVTAYEACYGHRPFVAATLDELVRAIEDGTIKPPPAGKRVPGRIHRALLRGLAHDPDRRFGSMTELLAELDPPRRRWPWIAAAAGVVAIPVFLMVALREPAAVAARCRSADERLAGVWDPARRTAVTAAFAAIPGHEPSGPRVVAELDGYAARWRAGWDQACTAPEQSSTLFDRQIRCLERLRSELALVGGAMAAADRNLAGKEFDLLRELTSTGKCTNPDALALQTEPPADQRDAADRIEQQLLVGAMALRSTRYDASRAAFESAVAESRAIGWKPFLTRALLGLGMLERVSDHLKEAEVAMREASATALAINDQQLIASTFLELGTVRINQGDVDGAAESLALSGGALVAMGSAAAEYQGQFLIVMGILRSAQNRNVEAVVFLDQAIVALETSLPVDRFTLAGALTGKGQLLDMMGRRGEARIALDRALALYDELVGPEHQNTAGAQALLAGVLAGDHEYAEARAMIEKAYATMLRTVGADDVSAIEVEDSLASLALELGDFTTALAHLEHVREVATAADPRSQKVTAARLGIGVVLTRMGKPREAIEQLLAVQTDVAREDPTSPIVAYVDLLLADARLAAGDTVEAAVFTQAEQRLIPIVGPESAEGGLARSGLGRTLLAQGKPRQAITALREALAMLLAHGEPFFTAQAQLALADALWQTDDKPGARASAVAARATLDELSPTASPDLRAKIVAWQRAHP
jgi:tetratricopeptide (TPR) repeat protein